MSAVGYIHHFESLGAVDGPGLRYVVFLQGCPLECLYCHNPDSRCMKDGKVFSVEQVLTEIEPFETWFHGTGGGLTLSGGESLMQPEFVAQLFQAAKKRGWHTALDTSGALLGPLQKEVLKHTDLVLLDIKSSITGVHKYLTHWDLSRVLAFADYLSEINKPVWIRHVLIPEITLTEENLVGLAEIVKKMKNVEKVEFLPYHKMGEEKWTKMGLNPPLADLPSATLQDVEWAKKIFSEAGYKGSYY